MLYAYIQKFDVTDNVGTFLRTKRLLKMNTSSAVVSDRYYCAAGSEPFLFPVQ